MTSHQILTLTADYVAMQQRGDADHNTLDEMCLLAFSALAASLLLALALISFVLAVA